MSYILSPLLSVLSVYPIKKFTPLVGEPKLLINHPMGRRCVVAKDDTTFATIESITHLHCFQKRKHWCVCGGGWRGEAIEGNLFNRKHTYSWTLHPHPAATDGSLCLDF